MSTESRPVELERALVEYRRLLQQRFGERLRSLVLFGSRARGDADSDSDADVSVVVQGLSEAERGEAVGLAFEAWRRTEPMAPVISPLVWSEAEREQRRCSERRIALDIDREGIALL